MMAHDPTPSHFVNHYGWPVMTELLELELGAASRDGGTDRFTTFEAGAGFVRCRFDADGKQFYREAASGEPGGHQITPESRARLIAAGFSLPGRTVNFSRTYPTPPYDDLKIARALLEVLRDAYGARAGQPLTADRNDGTRRRLEPTPGAMPWNLLQSPPAP
jgi:hypothetical protein